MAEHFDAESSRLLLATSDTSFWVAIDESDNMCLIADWAIGTGCLPTAAFAERGLWLEVDLQGHGFDVTLLPDGALTQESLAAIDQSGAEVYDSNLIVVDLDERPQSLIVQNQGGDVFDVSRTTRVPEG